MNACQHLDWARGIQSAILSEPPNDNAEELLYETRLIVRTVCSAIEKRASEQTHNVRVSSMLNIIRHLTHLL